MSDSQNLTDSIVASALGAAIFARYGLALGQAFTYPQKEDRGSDVGMSSGLDVLISNGEVDMLLAGGVGALAGALAGGVLGYTALKDRAKDLDFGVLMMHLFVGVISSYNERPTPVPESSPE